MPYYHKRVARLKPHLHGEKGSRVEESPSTRALNFSYISLQIEANHQQEKQRLARLEATSFPGFSREPRERGWARM